MTAWTLNLCDIVGSEFYEFVPLAVSSRVSNIALSSLVKTSRGVRNPRTARDLSLNLSAMEPRYG